MISVRLCENDLAQRSGAVRREQRLVARPVANEAGVDQQITFRRGDEVGVRDVLHHENGISDLVSLGLLRARHDQRAQWRLLFITHVRHLQIRP